MALRAPNGVQVVGDIKPGYENILSYDALVFLSELHRRFNNTRKQLMQARYDLQKRIDAGEPIKYPKADHSDDWVVAPVPADLQCRHVEITGPTERKMVINALNSGSDMFMADFEDSLSPTWNSIVEGQMNLIDANKKTITFTNPDDHSDDWVVVPVPPDLQCRHVEITGPTERKMFIDALNSSSDMFMADVEDSLSSTWNSIVEGQMNLIDANKKTITFMNSDGSVRKLKDKTAMLLVRVRGWHLDEKHILCDGEPLAGCLVDFGLYFYHNVQIRLANGTAPYYYLPKMESRLECRLWNNVFQFSEDYLKVPRGTIKATIMVETLLAAVEMEEMLYELKDYANGMNAGRWDYIFSIIKRLQNKADCVLPDRKMVSMTVPFMRQYTERLVRICHKHNAHAMGGMSAFIPSRKDPEINRVATEKVSQDKEREVGDGFDGTWVAHPDLVKLAKDIFVKGLQGKANQVHRKREEVNVPVEDLTTIQVDGWKVTEEGVRLNIAVALQYLNWWLQGLGAVAINNLMEDAATAEISRAQLWQWLRHRTRLVDGRTFTTDMYQQILKEELEKLGGEGKQKYGQAAKILDKLILSPSMEEFLTLPAYDILIQHSAKL